MSHAPMEVGLRRGPTCAVLVALVLWAAGLWAAPAVAETSPAASLPATLTDVAATDGQVSGVLTVDPGRDASTIDADSVEVRIDGVAVEADISIGAVPDRSAMLVIDTSGSMDQVGMPAVQSAVEQYLAVVPADVKVGVVSFANTSGVDVEPTLDHDQVSSVVAGLVSRGYTALYAAVDDAVGALGADGDRSIVLLSDGGDSVAPDPAAAARTAVAQLNESGVRIDVVAFDTDERVTGALTDLAAAGGGRVTEATDAEALSAAFSAAADTLKRQMAFSAPFGDAGGEVEVEVSGTAGGRPFVATRTVDLGAPAPAPSVSQTSTGTATATAAAAPTIVAGSPSSWNLYAGLVALVIAILALVAATVTPELRSSKSQRLESLDFFGAGNVTRVARREAQPSAVAAQLVLAGDRVMARREATSRTMALIERADLPLRAGEWLVLRVVAVVASAALFLVLLPGLPRLLSALVGAVLGFAAPPLVLRFLARRRARRFETILPDVLMLVSTSLASGFSLLQALDAVARDAAEPAAKEFSRTLAEARIGADVSDALEHMAVRMDSENMRWTTMAIRIQREVGGNLAETLTTTAKTLRERESLKRQVRTLSAEGRLSAYILIALPFFMFFYLTLVNYDYVSLLWTTPVGILLMVGGAIAMIVGIFWMRKVVQIEV